MNKKRTLIVLVLALAMLVGTMSTALAVYCMNCRVQLPDVASYCTAAAQGRMALARCLR